jgi:hypothetical protein
MTANSFLLQFQADVTNKKVVRPVIAETTALGAAYAAGLGVGLWKDIQELAAHWKVGARWSPRLPHEEIRRLTYRWNMAVKRSLGWADVLSGMADAPELSSHTSEAPTHATPIDTVTVTHTTPSGAVTRASNVAVVPDTIPVEEPLTLWTRVFGTGGVTSTQRRANLSHLIESVVLVAAGAIIGMTISRNLQPTPSLNTKP